MTEATPVSLAMAMAMFGSALWRIRRLEERKGNVLGFVLRLPGSALCSREDGGWPACGMVRPWPGDACHDPCLLYRGGR